MTDAPYPSALDAAAAVRRKEVSPTELMDHYLAEADRLNPVLNAFAFRDDDTARAQAAAATEAVASTPAEDLPPFHGVPMPIKDLDDVEGWPTTFGSRGTPTGPAEADVPEVARLRAAGFVFMGKSTTPEFGTVSMTESERLGITRNPWNTEHTPGGSSGGAGAAVASGMAPIAHASDGGGSIRIPASCNGLVGLKASRNRITGLVESVFGASTNGVVCWTVADAAAALDALAFYDTGSWNLAPPHARPYADEVGADPGRLRILVTSENAIGVPVEPSVQAAVDATARLLESLGHEVLTDGLVYPDAGKFLEGFLSAWTTLSAGIPVVDESLLEPHNQANRAQARALDAMTMVESVQSLQLLSRYFVEQFGRDFDVLVTPTMAVEPPKVGSIWEGMDADPGAPLFNCTPMAAYTAMFNVTGQPAISLPLHQAGSGLPVGVQFAAGAWQEGLLVRLASQVEAAAPWADRRPSL